MFERGVPLWCWWIPVVLVVSFPWAGFTCVPQWHRVHPAPFTDPADKPRDLIANVLLFVPFGYSYVRWRRRPWAWLEAVVLGAAVSIGAEATQLFSTLRHPSATDITAAASGALGGAALKTARDEKVTS
jgi:glycopeptide antibiotics resistance protein